MSQSLQEELRDRAQLLPTKDTLTALKSDVTLESAILELCDNSLDAWKRSNNRDDSTVINIEVNQKDGRTELVIRDNAGGLPRDDAAMLFGLGKTAKQHIAGSIGTFGVGAKKSLVNLGVPFSISSRHESEEAGWTYRITRDWFEDDQDWTVPINTTKELPPGTTEIRIEDLNYEWDEQTAEGIRTRLGQAYNQFLSDEMQALTGSEYNLRILVNDEPVLPEGIPDWSYSPFDGLFPRRYENIQLNSPESDAPVTLHITVGLLTKKNNQKAGTDIYCQKRKVASCLRNDIGGFGSGQDRIGNFSARHERLKVIVELETEGNGQILPWDTQKSSIDKHNPLMRGTDECRGVYNWLRRTVQAYYDLDADQVPQAFLESYDADHSWAKNGGRPVEYDYSERSRVISSHRPDTDLPETNTLLRKTRCHGILWISCEEELQEWKRDAYRSQLARESDRNVENLRSVGDIPPESVEETPHQTAGRITDLARIHYQNGVYYPDELEEWQLARYEGFIERRDERTLTEVSELPENTPSSLEEIKGGNGETLQTNGQGSAVYSEQVLEDTSKTSESAELFLVLGADSDDERGDRLIETNRRDLCRTLDIKSDVADEVLWEEMRQHIETSLDE